MFEDVREKENTKNLDSDRNLVGFFSILLEEARRIDPEKYLDRYEQKND